MSAKTAHPKQPVNRKVAVYIVMTIGLLIVIAFVLMFAHSNPRGKREAAQQAAARKAISALPKGTRAGAQTEIQQHVAADQPQSAASLYEAPIVKGATTGEKPAKASTAPMPPMDQTTLAQLEAAYNAAGTKPHLPGRPGDTGSQGGHGMLSIGSAARNAATDSNGVYQNYPKSRAAPGNAAQDTGLQPANGASTGAPKTYAAGEPLTAPKDRILTRGTLIRAVLTNAIDTRNRGTALATVTQNVYDSLNASTLLIPAGSKLVGTYQTTVQPGLPRIPIVFNTLYLPDGRMVDLSKTQAVNYAGDTGVPGSYHSNILRALGPSLVVALIGTAVDRWNQRGQQANSSQFGMQSPSVAEQMAPQVNSEVMSRYQGAQPYFIVKAGTAFKIVLGQNIVIPESASAAAHPPITGQPGAPGNGVWQAATGGNQ